MSSEGMTGRKHLYQTSKQPTNKRPSKQCSFRFIYRDRFFAIDHGIILLLRFLIITGPKLFEIISKFNKKSVYPTLLLIDIHRYNYAFWEECFLLVMTPDFIFQAEMSIAGPFTNFPCSSRTAHPVFPIV